VEGLYEEGVAPAELGWGTHERALPPDAHEHSDGPRNQICIARPGMETWVRSWVPSGEIHGMVIRHGEAFTISDHLTVWDDSTGNAVYRPTVHYAYHPSDSAIASILELRMRNLVMPEAQRILNNEISTGHDELGVLLMGHDYTSWWTGTILGIDEARSLVPEQSATTVQVAASVAAAVMWLCDEPEAGLCVPDDLPWESALKVARPYLGTLHSAPTDWTPLQNRKQIFGNWSSEQTDHTDPWQFTNFLVH
jgi:homospermidine synthase